MCAKNWSSYTLPTLAVDSRVVKMVQRTPGIQPMLILTMTTGIHTLTVFYLDQTTWPKSYLFLDILSDSINVGFTAS